MRPVVNFARKSEGTPALDVYVRSTDNPCFGLWRGKNRAMELEMAKSLERLRRRATTLILLVRLSKVVVSSGVTRWVCKPLVIVVVVALILNNQQSLNLLFLFPSSPFSSSMQQLLQMDPTWRSKDSIPKVEFLGNSASWPQALGNLWPRFVLICYSR